MALPVAADAVTFEIWSEHGYQGWEPTEATARRRIERESRKRRGTEWHLYRAATRADMAAGKPDLELVARYCNGQEIDE